MHPYMKTLKPRVEKICKDSGFDVHHIAVRRNIMWVYFHKESDAINASKLLSKPIRAILDDEGAGWTRDFDGLTDTWSRREGYTNTQGIEPEINFSNLCSGYGQ